ncbi:uncharacterized protein LOC134276358 [Saccostrea cucullata]|uniref:uncharacterized protein LOC134276358 n=1 Tax=Saccostrea cuccullata TaxID=36930 RepID=UPI002ED1117C
MLLVPLFGLAILQCLVVGAELTDTVNKFNDALDAGLDGVKVLIQNAEDHLPSAINQAFEYLDRLQKKPTGVTHVTKSIFETAKNTISQIQSETEKLFNALRVSSDNLKLPENILQLIAKHHEQQDQLIKKARQDIADFLAASNLRATKADEKLASYLQHKTNALKQVVTSVGSAVNGIVGNLQNIENSSLQKDVLEARISHVLQTGQKTIESAVSFANEEIKDAMSH